MEPLIIAKKDDTPEIHLDAAAGKFEFSGKSLPEDVSTFYAPVFEWIKNFSATASGSPVFVFKMTYFNTASSKIILDILMRLEEMKNAGKDVSVEWHYGEDDEDMKEAGEEYSEIVEVPFKFVEG
ncbi:MAG: DUF1987 domain-containing protein [Flavobacteriales bacterium]